MNKTKLRNVLIYGTLITVSAFFSRPLMAQTVFTSGTSNDNSGPEDINDYIVSDSFILTGADQVTGVGAVLWTDQGDTVDNIGYEISSGIDTGTVYSTNDNVTVSDGAVLSAGNDYGYQVESDSFDFTPFTLGPGTYYLSLYNPTTGSGDYAYWDDVASSSPSKAYLNGGYNDNQSTDPSTFTIFGTPVSSSTPSTPEPSPAIALLLGAVSIGCCAFFMMSKRSVSV